ncbi:MAG: exosortase H-associated membrane protein [Casimicrobiaceae bacterium]
MGRFVLRCLAWLPVAFAAWYFTAPALLAPATWLAQGFCALAFPELVKSVEQSAAVVTFVTHVGVDAATTGGVVTVDVSLLLYSFGLPLFAALTLAAQGVRRKRLLLIGYAVMLPFVAWGLVADFLKNVAITAAPIIASQTGFAAWQREAIALAYQLGSLILPTVVPVVLWVAMQLRTGTGHVFEMVSPPAD